MQHMKIIVSLLICGFLYLFPLAILAQGGPPPPPPSHGSSTNHHNSGPTAGGAPVGEGWFFISFCAGFAFVFRVIKVCKESKSVDL